MLKMKNGIFRFLKKSFHLNNFNNYNNKYL